MKELIHLPLEPYRQRYTEMLQDWESSTFSRYFNVQTVIPAQNKVVMDVQTGSVLDSVQRPLWALEQVASLLTQAIPLDSRIYLSDFFHPGVESLAYNPNQRYRIGAFCWAQTFDIYDFTNELLPWMRAWEVMATDIYAHVFVAHRMLKELISVALPQIADKVHVVGLPFNSADVRKRVDLKAIPREEFACVYTSRWDMEKNPKQFLQMVEHTPELNFAICTGWPELRGKDVEAINYANWLAKEADNLRIFTGLTKGEYYAILTRCKVQFNCASQDWISFTLLEALALGCLPLYPNRRSFPDTLHYRDEFLYEPNNWRDAVGKLKKLLETPPASPAFEILGYHDLTLNRIAEIMA